ncbi:MAG: hypoxanthine phosphoribosyltransferase [Chloroflexi bacterium]|nr:hypoxanthine phosphoribosyltransferase [Chloroflexota bacterium]
MVAGGETRLQVLISRQQIAAAVERLAVEVRRDYRDVSPLLVGVLRGAFVFLADLVRALEMPLTLDFVRMASYGTGTETSGKPRIVHGLRSPVKGRHLLVVEDIVDTGLTTRFLLDYLGAKGAASVKLCALLSKPARRQVDVPIHYLGFTVPDRFVVGYGLDFAQQYRYLPDVCVLEGAGVP